MQENEILEIDETEKEQVSNRSHFVRCSDGKIKEIKNYIASKAIKLMCTECMGFEYQYVRECTDKNCPLYPFRGPTLLNKSSIDNKIVSPAKMAAMEKARLTKKAKKEQKANLEKELQTP